MARTHSWRCSALTSSGRRGRRAAHRLRAKQRHEDSEEGERVARCFRRNSRMQVGAHGSHQQRQGADREDGINQGFPHHGGGECRCCPTLPPAERSAEKRSKGALDADKGIQEMHRQNQIKRPRRFEGRAVSPSPFQPFRQVCAPRATRPCQAQATLVGAMPPVPISPEPSLLRNLAEVPGLERGRRGWGWPLPAARSRGQPQGCRHGLDGGADPVGAAKTYVAEGSRLEG